MENRGEQEEVRIERGSAAARDKISKVDCVSMPPPHCAELV